MGLSPGLTFSHPLLSRRDRLQDNYYPVGRPAGQAGALVSRAVQGSGAWGRGCYSTSELLMGLQS